MNRTLLATLLAAAIAGAVGGGVVAALAGGDDSSAPATASTAPLPAAETGAGRVSSTEIYQRDAPGVVVITATHTENVPQTFFTPPATQKVSSLGSGFVIDRKGDILTNDHVVAGASGIRVGFGRGGSFAAKVIGTDPSSDLAVVRVNAPASALRPLAFDDSSRAQVGDVDYAIGNPFGLDRTMTAGIVSATGRDISAPNGLTIPNAIQTDAPINHGNSGGPLLDGSGNVIGVNAQIEGGTVDGNVGVGFAIPSDTARSVAQQLIAHGRVEHAWLGVQVETVPAGVAEVVRGLPSHGAAVERVLKNSPAARAGLRPATRTATVDGVSAPLGGDVIVAVDGQPIHSSTQLADAIAAHKPGDKVSVVVARGGATRTISIMLASAPSRA